MKLLFENWRKMLNEDITVLPTQANVTDLYSSYLENLNLASGNLADLKTLFEREGMDTENIDSIINLLEAIKDNDVLKLDVEGY